MIKVKTMKILSGVGVFLGSFLVAFSAGTTINPVVDTQAAESTLNTWVKPILKVEVSSSNVALNLSPTNNFSSNFVDFTVSTNNRTGYTMSLSSTSDNTDLKHQQDGINAKITSIASDTLKANLPNNTWGFSLDNETYKKIPALASAVNLKQTSTTVKDDKTKLYLGAKSGNNLPAGNYQGTVKVAIIANNPGRSLVDLTTMQEMTPEICNNTITPLPSANESTKEYIFDNNKVPEAELTDVRDNKTYVVRKLADGKCWMVQNLDLDLSTGTALTPVTSDVSSNWTPNNNTQASTGTSWSDDTSDNQARSYNPGEQYLTGTGSANQTVSTSGPKTAHVGNLYNWYAATAGSGTYNMSTTGQEAPHSICPKGWKLPYGNNSKKPTVDSGDFRRLTNIYGITSGSSTGNSDSILISKPLNSIRSGSYHHGGTYYGQGSRGYMWSSSISSKPIAHLFSFRKSDVNPQDKEGKGDGFSVRCLAR